MLAGVVALLAFAIDGVALAQNVAISTSAGGVTRSLAMHMPSTDEYVISQADCLSADAFTFPYTAMNFSGLNIEVWMDDTGGSIDCSTAAGRDPTAIGGHCSQLFSALPASSGDIVISSADIASKVDTVTMPGCIDGNSSSEQRPLTLFFMLVSAAGGDVDTTNYTKWTSTSLDMLGPPAPTLLMPGAADQAVTLTFTGSTATDQVGFNVYCDPPTTTAATTSTSTGSTTAATTAASTTAAATTSTGAAGGAASSTTAAAGTGGAGGSSGTSGTCTSTVLIPGQIPSKAYLCGTATSPMLTAKSLTDGTQYAIGVAAYDQVGNVGPLSALVCETPVPVTDFFDNYRAAGGQGGNCACSTAGSDFGWEAPVAAGGVLLAAMKRRKAKRARR